MKAKVAVSLPDRVSMHLTGYVAENGSSISEKQRDMLYRYSENKQILELLVEQYFTLRYNDQPELMLKDFVYRYIEQLLPIYG